MISTVEFLIARYASLQGLDLRDDPVLSVAQHHQERLQRIFRRRWRKTSRSYHPIHLRDLPDLVTHLLASSTSLWDSPFSGTMSRSIDGFTFGPCLMQCGCTFQGILLPALISHLLLALCHRTGTSGTLLLPWTYTYATYGFLPLHCSTLLL